MIKVCWLLLALIFTALPALSFGRLKVEGLRCEFRTDPIGIDSVAPRLSWTAKSVERGEIQTGYRVLVASSAERLAGDSGDLWDSGRVRNDRPFNVAYAGKTLESGVQAFWKVQVFDKQEHPSPWSKTATFEMGLLHSFDWTGLWINDGQKSPIEDRDFYREDPAPLFRKEFELEKPVKRARLYIAGLGYYEANLNGRKVGDHVLDPGWTNFASRVDYATYDVTDQVENGANCIGVTLGNGWYNPLPLRLFGSFNLRDHLPIGRPRFLAQLNVEFEDGSTQSIDSNLSWKVGDGAIRFDNVYLGEVVDARKERLGWSNAGFADAHWGSPAIATELVGALQAQPQPPIRITERIVPIHRSEPKPGVFIYDFGQEFAGWASIQLNAPTGAKMVLRYGELLKPDGTLNIMTSVAGQIKGSRKNEAGVEESVGGPGAPPIAWQSDTFIAKGGGKETYTPRFTFHGFRYLEVTGLPEPPALTDVTGLRLNSDVKDAGSFSCSNDRFNQIQQMVRRTFLANIFSVQSDCPHRERLGYGGDMVGTTEAFMLNFDMAAFYAKTVRDFADAKRPDGMLTDTAPFIGIQYCGVGWAMAHPLLTSQLNRYYGDYRLVETQYETAKEWLLLVSKQYEDGIVTDGLSDHESLEPNPSPEMVTPLYYQSALLLRGMAQGLDRKSDVEQFQALADKIKLAYQKSFVSRSGKVGPGTQGSQSFALYSDLLSPEDRGKALDFLLDKIRVDGKGHLSTGLMGTKFMLDTLSREGYAEDAYRIVDQPDFPGWQWMLTNGATTLWEHWAKEESVYSHCHPMFGSVSQWFINWLGGIQPAPGSFGFDQIVIRPQFVKELTWVKSSHTGMYGEIVSNWRREADKLVLDIDVPVGSTALVYLPAARQEQIQESLRPVQRDHNITFVRSEQSYQVLKVSSGHYEFSVLPH